VCNLAQFKGVAEMAILKDDRHTQARKKDLAFMNALYPSAYEARQKIERRIKTHITICTWLLYIVIGAFCFELFMGGI
jgi:hypothetical protein